MWRQAIESGRNQARNKIGEPFFLHPFGAERIAANHRADGGLYLTAKFGRFGVRVGDGRPGAVGLVWVRVLGRSKSRSWTVVYPRLVRPKLVRPKLVCPRLVVSCEVGVGTRTGEFRVMATSGGVALLLQK